MTAIQLFPMVAIPFSLSISYTTAEALQMPINEYDRYIDTPRYKKALRDEFISRYNNKDEQLLKWLRDYKTEETL